MEFPLPPQSKTRYSDISGLRDELKAEFVGKHITELHTPAFIVDRTTFAENCAAMHERVLSWGVKFRAHVKTHKTPEGARLQLQSTKGRTDSIIVSTLMEAWTMVHEGLVADGTINDILYGLPLGITKIADLAALEDAMRLHGGVVRLMIDSPDQVRALETYNVKQGRTDKWSVFFKVDLGDTKRAGLVPSSRAFTSLLTQLVSSPAISLYGFYAHAGTSYASTSLPSATAYLTDEINAVLAASTIAHSLLSSSSDPNITNQAHNPFVLSIGSTPTAHAFSKEAIVAELESRLKESGATLELHAGNYPLLDLQQLHTGIISPSSIAQRVLARVIATYPGRGEGVNGSDEAMCDAGGIAMSKDKGPIPGFGDVVRVVRDAKRIVGTSKGWAETGWRLGRVSQEHGVLVRKEPEADEKVEEGLRIGDLVEIVGQHACMISAAYPWYYVVENGGEKVVDIWVPCKGW